MSCSFNIAEVIGLATLLVAVVTLVYTIISSRKSENHIKLTNELLYKRTESELQRVCSEYENLKIKINMEADTVQSKYFSLGVKGVYVDRYKTQLRDYESRITKLSMELNELKNRVK